MKKLLAGLLVAGMLSITTAPVFAAAKIKDVDANYWARTEIAEVVDDSVMFLSNGKSTLKQKFQELISLPLY